MVGYGLYLDLIADAIDGKTRHMSELSQEEDRVRRAFELAAEGRSVALVSSGDAGVYGLAALAFEVLDHDDNPAWNRVALSVTPGVSAFQAAASRIGAPTGHDFCAISLSDLLTPWPAIERRLKAAADGDFVVALLQPRLETPADPSRDSARYPAYRPAGPYAGRAGPQPRARGRTDRGHPPRRTGTGARRHADHGPGGQQPEPRSSSAASTAGSTRRAVTRRSARSIAASSLVKEGGR